MYTRVEDYVNMVCSYCPTSITIHSNEKASFEGRVAEIPLFNVDLKFVNSSEENPEAKFVYSTSPKPLWRRLQIPSTKRLIFLWHREGGEKDRNFLPNDPKIQIPHIGEEWAQTLRAKLVEKVEASLQPMTEYIETLVALMDLIIDIDGYVAEAEEKYCNGEALQLAELQKLAESMMKKPIWWYIRCLAL